jgi:hypothetical protein
MDYRRDVTLADIALPEKIKNQPPTGGVTGVPHALCRNKRNCEVSHGQQGTSQKHKREGKDPDVEETLSQWFSVVTGRSVCQWSNVEKQDRGVS